MKFSLRHKALAGGLLLLALSACNGSGGTAGSGGSDVEARELSSDEITTLFYMREEEKLARDVYQYLHGRWGTPVFANIAEAEETHTGQVAEVIARLGLADPVADDSPGVFQDEQLSALYQQLTQAGSAGELEALMVGGLIEETDTMDLQAAIDATDEAVLQQLYANLMMGSRNHLRAFAGLIAEQTLVYEAQVLPQDQVDAILNTPMEITGVN